MMKPAGVKYDHDFLVSAIESGISSGNKDGIGGAVRKPFSNTLMMSKGYYPRSKNAFYEWLLSKDIKIEDEVMVHLRWGTHGDKTIYNQHPYILGEKSTANKQTQLSELTTHSNNVETGVFAHNGVFNYEHYKNQDFGLSDTYNWGITHFGSENKIKALVNAPTVILGTKEIAESLVGERVCFMFPTRSMVYKGFFIDDKGYLFSNSGYKKYTVDRGGSSNIRGFSELLDNNDSDIYDQDDSLIDLPRFQGCGLGGFNLSTNFDEDSRYDQYWASKLNRRTLPLLPVKTSTSTEDTDTKPTEPVEEEVIISKSEAATIKKLVNSSFGYELSLPKLEAKVIELPKTTNNIHSRASYYNTKYSRKHKKLNLRPLDKVIGIKTPDYIAKYAVPGDFFLPIKLTEENRKNFIVTNIHEESYKSIIFEPQCRFSVGLVNENQVYLKGTHLNSVDNTDDDTCWLKRTPDEISKNFVIAPKQLFVPIYRDYMRLIDNYGAEMSLNKSKKLRNLVDTIIRDRKNEEKTKGTITDKEYPYEKQKYQGLALIEYFNNFSKVILELKEKSKQSSLFNEPYSLIDTHHMSKNFD